jgi:hypothetical protein
LESWQADSRIVVGNELDGSEPWQGSILHIQVFPLHSTAVHQKDSQPWISYDFSKKAPYQADGSLSQGLDLVAKAGGIADAPLVSNGTAARLSEEIARAGSFKVVAEFAAVDTAANSPGRLVSLSSSASARNFMLGREGQDLVFRVRNGVMEENGRRSMLVARDALTIRRRAVIASYDHGIAALHEGRTLLRRIDLRQPSVYLGLGGDLGGAISAGALLGILVGFPLYCLLPNRDSQVGTLSALGGTICLAVLPFCGACWFVGGPINLSFIGMTSVAIGLAYLVAHFYCSNNVNALLS